MKCRKSKWFGLQSYVQEVLAASVGSFCNGSIHSCKYKIYTHKPLWNNSKASFTFLKDRNCSNMLESTYSYINGASQNVSYKSWVQLAVVIKVNKRVVQVFIQFFIYSIQPVFSTLFWYEILKIYHFRPISILENIFLLILICNYTHIQSQYICNLYYSNYVFESFLFKNVKSPVVA